MKFGDVAVLSALLLTSFAIPSSAEDMGKLAMDAVLERLSDPESARFRRVRELPPKNDWGPVVCGEVNSKNKFGGYIGFTKFLFIPSRGEVLFSEGLGDTPGSWC